MLHFFSINFVYYYIYNIIGNMVSLENIGDWIEVGDIFIAQWINDCGQVELLKITELTNPCPEGANFSTTDISGHIPAWCYDGTETITLDDNSDLIASNIKNWVTIFWVTWTYLWVAWINAPSFNMWTWLLVDTIPAGNYDWTETVTGVDADLIAGNIKNGVNIFWTTWTYTWEVNPWAFSNVGYHVWHTHWPIYLGWYDKFTTPISVWVTWDANNLYLCYSSYVSGGSYWWWYNYYSVVRYNSWAITTILSVCEAASTYYWHHVFFTESSTPWNFYVVFWYDSSWPLYLNREINIATWAINWTTIYLPSPNTNLQTTYLFGSKNYEPKLAVTTYFDTTTSYLDPYTALACNVNIYT